MSATYINEVQLQVMVTCAGCSRKSPSWVSVDNRYMTLGELHVPTDWKSVNLAPGCAPPSSYALKKMICPICIKESVTDASHADAVLAASSSYAIEEKP